MEQALQTIFADYSPAGDIAVVAICAVIAILIRTSYVVRNRSFLIFMNVVVLLVAASIINIAYHTFLTWNNPDFYNVVYVCRILYNALLLNVLFLFGLYITEVTQMNRQQARRFAIIACLLLVCTVGFDIVRSFMGYGFQIMPDGTIINKTNIYIIACIIYVALLLFLMTHVSHLLFKRVLYGFYGVVALSVIIRLAQLPLGQSSLTTMTFIFPVIAMLYILHSAPYNVTIGSVDLRAMENLISNMHARKEPFVFLSLQLTEYDEEGKNLPEDFKAAARRFSIDYFKDSVVFQLGNAHVIQIAPKSKNPDYQERIQNILKDFHKEYERMQYSYKVVIGESVDEISQKNEYVSLIASIGRDMPENTVHMLQSEDISKFNENEYVLSELLDIYNKKDLNDARVLAYCQPVFNLQTGMFDTAEALMRLDLDEAGIIFPDQFIPLAEQYGYIHVLTTIILNKTCNELYRLKEEGFFIKRISVNVSAFELKEDCFCDDINQIIEQNHIPRESIAIELTETRTEADFIIMKEKIEELHNQGVQFYLDDFGTGYSNIERIMTLPFDIIKFDRSLVIASRDNVHSEKLIENLAHMFSNMDYSLLYEGIENDKDEKRCKEMSASYLQGYKYSRPVPIKELRKFLSKK